MVIKKIVFLVLAVVLSQKMLIANESQYSKLHKEQADYFEQITEQQAPVISLDLVDEPLFTFAMIADTHVGTRDSFMSNAMPYRVVEVWRQINGFMPSFTLHLGDMTTGWPQMGDHQGELEHALYIDKTNSRVLVHYTPGNHDVGNKRSQDDHSGLKLGVTEETLTAYRKFFGADYYSFHHKGYRFICINTQLFNSDLADNRLQWNWLEDELEKGQSDKGIFVFTHYPLFMNCPKTDPGEISYEVIDEPDRSRLLELFKQKGVDAVYSGHTHWMIDNYMQGIEFHALYSATFPRAFFETNIERGYYTVRGAWRFNPLKVGYGVARVYPDKTVLQFVQSYPKLPKVEQFQKGSNSGVYRLLPKSAAELDKSSIGVFIDIPEISKERRLADRSPSSLDESWISANRKDMAKQPEGPIVAGRDYTIAAPIELAAQQGVKKMFINEPFNPDKWSQKKREEFDRMLRLGVPRGVELILPLCLDLDMIAALDLSKFENISDFQLLNTDSDGKKYSDDKYLKLLDSACKLLQSKTENVKLIGSAIDIDSQTKVQSILSSVSSSFVDVLIFDVDIAGISEDKYYSTIGSIKESLADKEIWVYLTNSNKADNPLETVTFDDAKQMQRIFVYNQSNDIYSFLDSRNTSGFSLLNNDYDPTFLYYAVASLNTVFSGGWQQASLDISISSDVNHRICRKGNDFYIQLSKQDGEPVEYVDLAMDQGFSEAVYIDALSSTVGKLDITDGDNTVIRNLRVADYPVFIKLSN